MSKKTVLLCIDHAPNYREEFLRQLGEKFNLIVLSHSCENDMLTSPEERIGYIFHELKYIGNRIRFNKSLKKYISNYNPDVICVALNLRYPVRCLDFLINKNWQKKWVWWGQIYGKNNSKIFNTIKKYLIKKSFGTLVYTLDIKDKLNEDNVLSFNNSQYPRKRFKNYKQEFGNRLKCLFVGRPQARKRLDILVYLAKTRNDLEFRIVGPEMKEYFQNVNIPPNMSILPAAYGIKLEEHFKWSNLVVNPGHVGLLVINSAAHCRPIVINNNVNHAPELYLAKEANQYMINFSDKDEINKFLDMIITNTQMLEKSGKKLFKIAKKKYTIENMVDVHYNMFNRVK